MRQFIGGTMLILLGLLAAAVSGPARGTEVYTWTDENGTPHYSDSPPPSGTGKVIEVEEAYRPGTAGAYPDPEQTAAPEEAEAPGTTETPAPTETPEPAAAPEEAVAPEETPKTPAQERREQLARERAEHRKADAEAERLCAFHRQRLEQMEPARRVFYTNEAGESVRMDDDVRVGLIDESKAFLAANCD
jgi:hypothetical protein